MPEGCWFMQLLVYQRFEETVLIEHLGGLADGVAGKIIHDHLWHQQDFATVTDDSAIKLVVLIAHQLFIKKSDFVENVASESTERYGIDPHFPVGANAEVGVAHAERTAHGVRDSATHRRVFGRQRIANATDIIRICGSQLAD